MDDSLEIDAVYGTATVGGVINALRRAESDASVIFDFCGVAPTSVASSRNYYEHLAIGWCDEFDGSWPTASSVVKILESAISPNNSFEGYKGGQYRMNKDTPLWVDKWGDSTGTGIVGVEYLGEYCVVLKTAKVD